MASALLFLYQCVALCIFTHTTSPSLEKISGFLMCVLCSFMFLLCAMVAVVVLFCSVVFVPVCCSVYLFSSLWCWCYLFVFFVCVLCLCSLFVFFVCSIGHPIFVWEWGVLCFVFCVLCFVFCVLCFVCCVLSERESHVVLEVIYGHKSVYVCLSRSFCVLLYCSVSVWMKPIVSIFPLCVCLSLSWWGQCWWWANAKPVCLPSPGVVPVVWLCTLFCVLLSLTFSLLYCCSAWDVCCVLCLVLVCAFVGVVLCHTALFGDTYCLLLWLLLSCVFGYSFFFCMWASFLFSFLSQVILSLFNRVCSFCVCVSCVFFFLPLLL